MTCKNQYALFLIDDMVVLLLLFANWQKDLLVFSLFFIASVSRS